MNGEREETVALSLRRADKMGGSFIYEGPIPSSYSKEEELNETSYLLPRESGNILVYFIKEGTSFKKLYESTILIEEKIKLFLLDLIDRGINTRKKIQDRFVWPADLDIGKVIVSLEREGRLTERKDGTLERPNLEEKMLRRILNGEIEHENVEESLRNLDWLEDQVQKGRAIARNLKEEDEVINKNGVMCPSFFQKEKNVLRVEPRRGQEAKWEIQIVDRWNKAIDEYIIKDAEKSDIEDKGSKPYGYIDLSGCDAGEHFLLATIKYLALLGRGESYQEKAPEKKEKEVGYEKITVPPSATVYGFDEANESILEIEGPPEEMYRSGCKIIDLSDGNPIDLSETRWVQEKGRSYTRIKGGPNFSLRVDGAGWPRWLKKQSIERLFKTSPVLLACAPKGSFRYKMEVNDAIPELFDMKPEEIFELEVNGNKTDPDEKLGPKIFLEWKARKPENSITVRANLGENSLELDRDSWRVAFPEPKIEIMNSG